MATSVIFLSLIAACFAQHTIIDVLKQRHATTLLDLIQTAGLTDELTTGGPYTLFAPTNAAFSSHLSSAQLAQVKADPDHLANLIKYFLVSGKFTHNDLMVNEKMLTSVAGEPVRVNYYLYNRHVAVEGARLTTFDQLADNGIVHLIDAPMMAPNGTIWDIIMNDPQYSTLKTALENAGLDTMLQNGPYTFFAPTNAAFTALGDDVTQKLLANPELLKSVLLYHITHGTLYSTGMHSGYLPNLEETDNERIYASYNARILRIDNAQVTKKDQSATNGVVHTINHVLIPSSLAAQVKALSTA